jgi:hypothetical protein
LTLELSNSTIDAQTEKHRPNGFADTRDYGLLELVDTQNALRSMKTLIDIDYPLTNAAPHIFSIKINTASGAVLRVNLPHHYIVGPTLLLVVDQEASHPVSRQLAILNNSESAFVATIESPVPNEGTTDQDAYLLNISEQLVFRVRSAFNAAADEMFEYGMESTFSRALNDMVRGYGELVISAISSVLRSERPSTEVVAEALHQLGMIEDPKTHRSRLRVLLRYLPSRHPQIRDAVSIGLSTMDDPTAIRPLRDAINSESSLWVRRNLQLVLDQLEETKRWPNS